MPYFEENERTLGEDERTQAILTTKGMLWDMFASLLKEDELIPMYCVLDGFDECDGVSKSWLAAKFATLSSNPRLNNLRLAIVSRDMPDLRYINQRILIDPDNNDKVGSDVEVFTTLKMHELSRRLNLSESSA